jgi:repressor LexA
MMARRTTRLGERHRKIMQFLTSFQETKGYSPSIREIGESINVKSTSLVDYYLRQLENMEYIRRDQNTSRSIQILRPMRSIGSRMVEVAQNALGELISLPLVGRIRAGQPIPVPPSDLNYFDAESTVDIARSLLPAREKPGELFALEVEGDSMIDAMINDGDIVIMKRAEEAHNGEMVAVWLDDTNETTLKYFYRDDKNKRVRLEPANPTMKPIYIDDPSRLRIMGKVVMVIRQVKSIAA